MAYYDWFAPFYDASVEALYAPSRPIAAEALRLDGARRVLDLPTGTGSSLPALVRDGGAVVAADLSSGMLARARSKAQAAGIEAQFVQVDVTKLDEQAIGGSVDRIHCFLGLTAFPDWPHCFERLWSVLEPGGWMVAVDVHADPLGMQGHMVQLTARADLRRRWWEPLEQRAEQFERRSLDSPWQLGGQLALATGRKPQ